MESPERETRNKSGRKIQPLDLLEWLGWRVACLMATQFRFVERQLSGARPLSKYTTPQLQNDGGSDEPWGGKMSWMFEVVYRKPEDRDRERRLAECASHYGGVVTYREDDWGQLQAAICLTIEFPTLELAQTAASEFLEMGEFMEGPIQDYG